MGGKRDKTRSRIVETAGVLFHERGYTNTSMDDIVRKSGVTKGSVYYHFSSKEELGSAVVSDLVAQWLSGGASFLKKEDPIRQIVAMFRRTEKELEERECRGGCLFGNLALEVSDLHDGLRESLEEAFLKWEGEVEKVLQEGKSRGILTPALDARAAASFVLASFEGAILLSKVKKNVRVFKSCTESIKAFLEAFRA
jgi:TetR/AcrR family transcriptional repressor of nem operon